MRLMTDHDDLDRRLRAANRVPTGVVHTPAFRVRLDEIRVQARSGPRDTEPRTRRRLPVARRGVVLASVVGVVTVAGAAADKASSALIRRASRTGQDSRSAMM